MIKILKETYLTGGKQMNYRCDRFITMTADLVGRGGSAVPRNDAIIIFSG